VSPARLLEIARRNDVRLPGRTEAGLARFCRFKDFDHFNPRLDQDHEGAASRARLPPDRRGLRRRPGCPGMLLRRGAVLSVGADGAGHAVAGVLRGILQRRRRGARGARRRYPLHTRHHARLPVEIADQSGALGGEVPRTRSGGISLGGSEHKYPPELFRAALRRGSRGRAQGRAARRRGRRAGVGARSARCAARRPPAARCARRGGPRAARRDRRRAASSATSRRRATCSSASCRRWPSIRCRACFAAGVRCSISSDDPVLMDTTLSRDCAAAAGLGHAPRDMFEHALGGVLLRRLHEGPPAPARRRFRLGGRIRVTARSGLRLA